MATKYKDYSLNDLTTLILESKSKLTKLKFTHAISPLQDTSEIKKLRKEIARMCTVSTELKS